MAFVDDDGYQVCDVCGAKSPNLPAAFDHWSLNHDPDDEE